MAGSPYFMQFMVAAPSCLAIGQPPARRGGFAQKFSGRTTALCAGACSRFCRVTWAESSAPRVSVTAAILADRVAAVRCSASGGGCSTRWFLMLSILVSINLALLNLPAYATMVPAAFGVRKSHKSPVIWWTVVTAAALSKTADISSILFAHGRLAGRVDRRVEQKRDLDARHCRYFDRSVPFAILAGPHRRCRHRASGQALVDPVAIATGSPVLVSAAWMSCHRRRLALTLSSLEPIYRAT